MLEYNALNQIISDWSYWDQTPPPSVPRRILKTHPLSLSPDLILVIQGVRRAGKSTLLSQIMHSLSLSPHQCTFVNFEDPRLSQDLDYKLLDQIVEFSTKKFGFSKPHYFFLDEIQEVQNWQKWLHLKIERPGPHYFIITGSNASLLSGELSTALTGRHITLELFPFDFQEYQVLRPNKQIEDYMEEGGFPRVLQESRPKELLRQYFTDIIERDVRRHVSARSSTSLSKLVKAVFESTGSEVSQRNLAGMLGVTTDTIGVYLAACEAAYVIFPCSYFTFSEKQRTARHRKFYPVDLGLRNAIATKTGLDKGKILETIVFHHLRKHFSEVCYWRQKGEVDFVTSDTSGVTPYQVSWDGTKDRHRKALDEFYKIFPDANEVILISRDNIEEILFKEN